MYNEVAPEFILDQGLYYPSATNYGYYCSGLSSPSEWEDHQRIFAVDGSGYQYVGMQTESLPFIYYAPGYGYEQSPFNPYNPFIPGAVIGVDGQMVGAQQYYTFPSFQSQVTSPSYAPLVVQPDIAPSRTELLLDSCAPVANRFDEMTFNSNIAPASVTFSRNLLQPATYETNSLSRGADVPMANTGSSKPTMHGGVSSGVFSAPTHHMFQGRTASAPITPVDSISSDRMFPLGQFKDSSLVSNGFSNLGSVGQRQSGSDRLRPKFYGERALNEAIGSSDALVEQNRGPRTCRSQSQLVVKAFTTQAGHINTQGNIVISTDQYNKDNFPVEYVNAKFFVIKSYSEDDVHKSIKYNVWSSTPHGNNKLQNAYKDAQKVVLDNSTGCPIFLFFSVNASGQFCGVAEMVGPVDFHSNMDFWQQDKWSGCFSVKWNIIKDVPNTNFRHIILENNENKPVTNSRDTQEIMHKQGLEMLKIFKEHPLKTSILDDFVFYENRQRVMQEEKARVLRKSFRNPFLVPGLESVDKKIFRSQMLPNKDEKISNHDDGNCSKVPLVSAVNKTCPSCNIKNANNTEENTEQVGVELKDEVTSTLRIDSLSKGLEQAESKPVVDVALPNFPTVLTVGSIPVKVNGFGHSPKVLTVGSIPLALRSIHPKNDS